MPEELPEEKLFQLTDALEKGRTIEAIKIYRAATGVDLKEAKDAVETLYADLREQDPLRFPERKASVGCGSSAALFALAFLVVCFYTIQRWV